MYNVKLKYNDLLFVHLIYFDKICETVLKILWVMNNAILLFLGIHYLSCLFTQVVQFLYLRLFRTFAISNKISVPLRIRNNGRLLYF